MPMLRLLLALSFLPLGGCAWLLGHGEPPQPEAPFMAETPSVEAEAEGLRVRARFEGLGRRLVSERNWVGRAGTVVNPYGADTLVFSLSLTNGGQGPVVLLPQSARLAFGDRPPLAARTLEDYRARWPLWAVRTAEDRDHRARAYTHVLETLLIERRLAPGETVEGKLAFPVAPARDPMTLVLPFERDLKRHDLVVAWRLP